MDPLTGEPEVFVDFDHTLWDTDAAYRGIADHLGISYTEMELFKDLLEETYNAETPASPAQTYDPGVHAERLNAALGTDLDGDDISAAYRTLPQYLRDDVTKLAAIDTPVRLCTRKSHDGWQELKVQFSGVREYVDAVTIVDTEPKYAPQMAVLADDSISEKHDARRRADHEFAFVHFDDFEQRTVQDIIEAVENSMAQ